MAPTKNFNKTKNVNLKPSKSLNKKVVAKKIKVVTNKKVANKKVVANKEEKGKQPKIIDLPAFQGSTTQTMPANMPAVDIIDESASVPVDKQCTLKGRVHVFCDDSAVYGVMLNQTNLDDNNNKCYVIQLLEQEHDQETEQEQEHNQETEQEQEHNQETEQEQEHNQETEQEQEHNQETEQKQKTKYLLWTHWARVGEKGRNQLKKFGGNLRKAKKCFLEKFLDKTGNSWNNRDNFQKMYKKYDLLHIDYAEMKYDTNTFPLGRLSESQIEAGYSALRQIEELIKKGNIHGAELTQACSVYYTRVPHNFGRRHPPQITSMQSIKREKKLLELFRNYNQK